VVGAGQEAERDHSHVQIQQSIQASPSAKGTALTSPHHPIQEFLPRKGEEEQFKGRVAAQEHYFRSYSNYSAAPEKQQVQLPIDNSGTEKATASSTPAANSTVFWLPRVPAPAAVAFAPRGFGVR
jgi:hypothetical protein